PACNQLVQRIESRDLAGFTSTAVLGEVGHQLMIAEASKLPGWSLGKVKQRLSQQPNVVQTLSLFRRAVDAVLQSSLKALTIAPSLLGTGNAISQQHGLLTNDALIVAVMH